jgi:hypothetical protein
MLSILKHHRYRRLRAAVRTRREQREHFVRGVGEVAALAIRAMDTPGFENRGFYIRSCLAMIQDKAAKLGELK